MEGRWKTVWSWWKSRATSLVSVSLWRVVVPLMVVFGIVTLWGSKGSNNLVGAGGNNPTWVWRSPSTATSMIMNITSTALSSNVVQDPMSNSPPSWDGGILSDDNHTFKFSNINPVSLSPPLAQDPMSNSPPSWDGGILSDDNHTFKFSNINPVSLSPPLAPELIGEIEKPGMQKEEILNATVNSSHVKFSQNESDAPPPLGTRIRRKFSNLGRLEAKMQQARLAIRGATKGNQSYDPDYVPGGPMYWNANAFHRSYLEMEKQFKIYVYEEGDPPIFHDGPCKSIYSMEGNFIHHMEISKFRTRDLDKAHMYFIPISVVSIVRFIRDPNFRNQWHPLKQTFKDYVDLIAGKYPYWNRSIGADHFFLSCHDWGPELSKSVPELFKNSIRALCNANTSEGFNPSKDVSIPEINLPRGTLNGIIGGPSPSRRTILAFYAGRMHGPIRPALMEHWENKDEDIQVHSYLPKGVSYYGMLKKSKFCICPSGYEVASPRMVEALYTGCVPVIIKDHYVPPFSDVLNWKTFSVEIPVNDIPNMKMILSKISKRQYIRMQRRGKDIRRHFEVNLPPKRYDVFHMTLHSVWLRRLNTGLQGLEEV